MPDDNHSNNLDSNQGTLCTMNTRATEFASLHYPKTPNDNQISSFPKFVLPRIETGTSFNWRTGQTVRPPRSSLQLFSLNKIWRFTPLYNQDCSVEMLSVGIKISRLYLFVEQNITIVTKIRSVFLRRLKTIKSINKMYL